MDDREKLMIPYIKKKNVLDIGAADISSGRFLHKFLRDNAKKVIGIEINHKKAESLIKKGYNIIVGNAENISLKERFDVVVAGDLIEHLENAGVFMENMNKHLKKKGKFIINTPNIYSLNMTLRSLILLGNVKQFNEHTTGFNEQLLSALLKRHGFEISNVHYFNYSERSLRNRIMRILTRPFPRWRENILVIAQRGG